MTGCRIKKNIVKEDAKMSEERALILNVIEHQTREKWLEIRFTGKAKSGDQAINLNGTLKIAENEWIWISLRSQIGIEIARVFATRDSVWLSSKLLKIKEKGNWDLIREYTGYQVGFGDIQGILRQTFLEETEGDPVQVAGSYRVVHENETIWLEKAVGSFKNVLNENNEKQKSARYRISDQDFRIMETLIEDEKENPSIRVFYTYAEQALGRIKVEGCGNLNDYSLEMHITAYESKPGLEYNFDKW